MAEQKDTPIDPEYDSILQIAEDISQTIAKNSDITVGINKSRISRLGGWIDTCVKQKKFSGASVAVFRKNQLVYDSYHGYSDLETLDPITKDSLFRMYSMTKPITSIALMILFDENKFQLNDPVSKYIPNFAKIPGIYDYENNKDIDPKDIELSKIKVKPIKQPILIWHLLSHTAGISYQFDVTGQMEPVDVLYKKEVDFHGDMKQNLGELIDNKMSKMPLTSEPGTEWNYSHCTDICGRLIEVISGKNLDEFLDERIFKPLNMNNTAFYIENKFNDLLQKNLTTLYQPSWFGKPPDKVPPNEWRNYKLIKNVTMQNQSNANGKGVRLSGGGSAGGVLSTLNDYMQFCKMLLNNGVSETGKEIIKSETLKLMRKNYLPDNCDLMKACCPRSMLKKIIEVEDIGFGLGFGLLMKDSKKTNWSTGSYFWSGAAATKFWIDPKNDLCVVFMTQLLGNSDKLFDINQFLGKYVYSSIVD